MDTFLDEVLWDEIILVSGEERADKCLDYSWDEFKRSNYTSAQILAECALDIYKKRGNAVDTYKIVTSYYAIASCLTYRGSSKEAGDLLISLSEFVREYDGKEYFESMEWAARVYIESSDFELAFKVIEKILSDPMLILTNEEMIGLFISKATCLHRLKQMEAAISAYKKVIDLLPKAGLDQRSPIYEELSICYANSNQGLPALKYARLALDYALIKNDRFRLQNSHWAMARAKESLGDLSSALLHFLRCKEIIQKDSSPDFQWLLAIERHIAQLYSDTGKLREAEAIRKRIENLDCEVAVER